MAVAGSGANGCDMSTEDADDCDDNADKTPPLSGKTRPRKLGKTEAEIAPLTPKAQTQPPPVHAARRTPAGPPPATPPYTPRLMPPPITPLTPGSPGIWQPRPFTPNPAFLGNPSVPFGMPASSLVGHDPLPGQFATVVHAVSDPQALHEHRSVESNGRDRERSPRRDQGDALAAMADTVQTLVGYFVKSYMSQLPPVAPQTNWWGSNSSSSNSWNQSGWDGWHGGSNGADSDNSGRSTSSNQWYGSSNNGGSGWDWSQDNRGHHWDPRGDTDGHGDGHGVTVRRP